MPVRQPSDLLPVKPTEFLVLLMLAEGERHGYRLMQDIAAQTDGRIQLEAGSLYRTIRRMQDDGLVEESSRRPAADLDDERRRYYRLTAFGKRVVTAEAVRLRELVRVAESSLSLPPLPAR